MHKRLVTLFLMGLFLLVSTMSALAEEEYLLLDGREDEDIEASTVLYDVPATYTYTLIKEPSHGMILSFRPPDHITYRPAPNYNGADAFTVKIHIVFDGDDAEEEDWIGVYDVTIEPVNDIPIATPMSISTMKNNPVSMQLSGSDPVEGDSLTFSVWTSPNHGILSDASHGQITDMADQTIVYTPEPDYVGNDSFGYVVFDGTDYSDEAIARITVLDPEFAHAVLIGTSSYFYRILDAYASADPGGTVIKMRDMDFSDDMLLDLDKQVSLVGGYDELFTSNAGRTTIVPGPLVIKSGGVTLANITVK
jgi:hypothetical protein